MQRGRSSVSLLDLINAGMIQPGEKLRFYNRDNILAEVTARGTVLFRGVEYQSLSAAGSSVTNHAVNGWAAWRVKLPEVGWINISELRPRVEKLSEG